MKGGKSVKPAKVAGPPKPKLKPPAAWNPTWLHLGLLVVLVVVVYSNALHGEFVFDDQQIVLQNPVVQHIENWGDAMRAGGGWRAVLYMTYGLNFLWSGLNSYSYHFVNILIHVINVLLIYFIVRRLAPPNRAKTAALAGAAVFAVHTLLSSGVVYITARSSTFCATFYFGAILLFLKAWPVQPAVPPAVDLARDKRDFVSSMSLRILWLVLAAGAGWLAWQVKQEAIALPVFLAGMVWLRNQKKDWRLLGLFGILGAIPLAVMWVFRDLLRGIYAATSANSILVNAGFDTVLAPAVYFFTYATAIVEYYLPRFIVPLGLSADPHILPVEQWYSPEFILALLVLGGLAFISLKMARREPLLSVGIAALLLSPLTAYAVVPLADPVLEYRSYIPGLGVALLAGWAALRVPWPAVAAYVLLLSAMTYVRNPVWNTAITLWEDAVLKSPNKSRTQFNLGASYQNAARTQDAINQYNKALKVKPKMWAAYSNLSAVLVDTGQWDEAEKMLLMVTSSSPQYTEAWINLCVLYLRRNRTDEAIKAARSAVATNDGAFAAEYNLAEALTQRAGSRKISDPDRAVAEKETEAQKADYKEALEHYERSVYLRPDMWAFQITLGMAHERAGDREGALKVYKSLTETPIPKDSNTPDYGAEAYRKWAALVSAAGDEDQAIDLIKKALARRPGLFDAYFDLGLIYDKKKQYDPAGEQFKKVLKLNSIHGPAVLNLAMEYSEHLANIAEAKAVLKTWLEQKGAAQSSWFKQVQERLSSLEARGAP